MIGNHAISLLADAWAKGIHTFDPEKALKAYYHEATNKGPWGPANGRDGWKEYFTLGYVPYPKYGEATAKTLEYAYDDFCGYRLAEMTGNAFFQNVFPVRCTTTKMCLIHESISCVGETKMANGRPISIRMNGVALSPRAMPGIIFGRYFTM